jgi:predicted DNA-binding transcriptional regulator AlpA
LVEPEVVETRFLCGRELQRRWGLSKTRLRDLEKSDPHFPRRYRFGTRGVRYRLEEVQEYELSLVQ